MKFLAVLTLTLLMSKCSPSGDTVDPAPTPTPNPPAAVTNEMDFWLTKGNQSVALQKQTSILAFGTAYNNYGTIEVDDSQTFQSIDGFGYTLTGGSAQVINLLNAQKRQELLQELFGAIQIQLQ